MLAHTTLKQTLRFVIVVAILGFSSIISAQEIEIERPVERDPSIPKPGIPHPSRGSLEAVKFPDLPPGTLRTQAYDFSQLTSVDEQRAFLLCLDKEIPPGAVQNLGQLQPKTVRTRFLEIAKQGKEDRLELLVYLSSKSNLPWNGASAEVLASYVSRIKQVYHVTMKNQSTDLNYEVLADGASLLALTPSLVLDNRIVPGEFKWVSKNLKVVSSIEVFQSDRQTAQIPAVAVSVKAPPLSWRAKTNQDHTNHTKPNADDIQKEPEKKLPMMVRSTDIVSGKVITISTDKTRAKFQLGVNDALVLKRLSEIAANQELTVHRGDEIPDEWLKILTDNWKIPYVRQTEQSQNRSTMEIVTAAHLGDKKPSPQDLRIFSALPKRRGLFSIFELWRMNIPLDQTKQWHELDDQIRQTANRLSLNVVDAKKEVLLQEIRNGSNDALLIFAHNEYGRFYMSGVNGESISFDEIQNISRTTAPPRAIYLITCSEGSVNHGVESLAETMLKNKLAQTVFASTTDVDARKVPALLDALLRAHSPREAMREFGFIQIVFRVPKQTSRRS
jgi:hypothetical protein